MILTEHHTDDGWRFRWQRDQAVQVELEWVHGRSRWLRRTQVDDGCWSPPQLVALGTPADEDDARRLAEQHAIGVATT